MIYQCPRCDAFNDVPVDYHMMRDVSLQCGHCAHMAHYHNANAANYEDTFYEDTFDEKKADNLIICDDCTSTLTLSHHDHLLLTKSQLACPFCGADLRFAPDKDTSSSLMLFIQLFVICACEIGALFLLLTPAGAHFISYLGTYSDKPIYYILTMRAAFFDMMAFLKGLFL